MRQDRVRRSVLRTRSLTFQFQVEVLKIFLKLFIVQAQGKKSAKIPRTQGSELGAQSSSSTP